MSPIVGRIDRMRTTATATRAMRSARKGASIVLTITTIVWALGIPLGVLVPQPTRAADIAASVTVTPSSPVTSASGVTYTARLKATTASSGNVRAFFMDLVNVTGISLGTVSTCSLSVNGTAVSGVPLSSCTLGGTTAVLSTSVNPVTLAANDVVVFSIGPFTHAAGALTNVNVSAGFSTDADNAVGTSVDSGTVAVSIAAAAPTLSGGGPQNGSTGVPDEARMDILASADLKASGPSSPVYTETSIPVNVTLNECTGATDAITCANPNTMVNRCSTVTIENSRTIVCNLAVGTRLNTNTTYKFTVNGRVANTSNVVLGASTSRIFRTGSVSAGTNTTMPVVLSRAPAPGAMSVPTNAALMFTFPMGPEGDMKNSVDNAGSTNLVDSFKAIRIRGVTNGVFGATDLCGATGCTLTWSSSTRTLLVTITGGLTANTQYDVCVVGGAAASATDEAIKNKQGIGLTADVCSNFSTGSGTDSTAPALAASNPLDPADAATGVDRFRSDVRVSMGEAVQESTVTLGNVRLYIDDGAGGGIATDGIRQSGETVLGASALSIDLEPDGHTVRLGMNAALGASTRYCYEIGTGLKDLAGNAATAVANKCFTTGSQSDSTAPTLLSLDCDSFKCAAQFSEGVASSTAVNTANYTLACGAGVDSLTSVISLTGKTLTYFADRRELEIAGLGLMPGNFCRLTVGTSVTDLAGNTFSTAGEDEFETVVVLDAAVTGGFIGSSGATQDFHTATDFASFWESPQRCEPRSRITNKSTVVDCEFKVPAALAASSTFTLTFPSEFTMSDGSGNARAVPTTSSWSNSDLNGPAANAPAIASATCSEASSTCIVTTGTATIANGEMVRFELDRITTPTTAQTDKRITVIVKDANGIKQGETINPAPFSIGEGGARSISGKVCKSTTTDGDCADAGDTAIASMKVFCDQMGGYMVGTTAGVFSGHQDTTTGVDGTWTISGISDGQYSCSLPPDPTTMGNIMGGNAWKSISVSGGNVTNVDFDFTDMDAVGQSLVVTLTGSAALATKQLDAFCMAGATDFQFSAPVMKVVTLDGSGNGTVTMKLLGGKSYDCSVGPHMDFSAFSSGGPPPVPKFDFLPPQMQRVNVVAGTDPSGITFALTAASNTITVNVCDGGTNDASNCGTAGKGTGIANVFVNAAPMGCFNADGSFKMCFGGFTQTDTNGIGTLNVTPGEYEIMANGPGLPSGDPVAVTVLVDGTVQQKGATVTQVTIKLSKSSTTISGQILDESGLGIPYAHVSGERIVAGGNCTSFSPFGGWRDSPTDSSGNYTLYVGSGSWNVSAFAPAYGEVGCTTVTISDTTSATGQNIQATAGNYGTITGTCPDGSFVGAFGTAGGNNSVCSEGTYSMKVKTGTYTVDCHAPGSGPCGNSTSQAVTSSGTTTVNFSTSVTTGTVQVTITGITDAFLDLRDASGQGNGTGQNTNGVYTIKTPAGTYTLRGGSPKYGEICSGQTVVVTANTTTTATCTPPANLRSISGRITDGSANVPGATVTLTSSSGKIFNVTSSAQAGSTANLAVSNVPDGTYTLRAAKKGYESAATTATVSGGNLSLSDSVAMTPTTGSNGDAVTIQTQASSATYTGSGRVVATKGTGSSTRTVVGDIDSTNGQATLDLGNGTWTVKAIGDNGKESATSTVTVTSGAIVGSAPTLGLDTAVSGFTAKSDSPTMTPKSGADITSETCSPVSGKSVGVTIPAGALSATDASTGKVEMKLDPTVAGIDPGEDLNFVGAQGIEITPKDSGGNALGDISLYSNATIQIPYTDADVAAAGVSESLLVLGAINTNGEWESFPTTVDTTNNIITAEVTHFSTFGILGGGSAGSPDSSDTTAPAAPSAITSSATADSVTLQWTDPADTDLSEIEVLRNTPPSSAVSGTTFARVAKGVKKFIDTAVAAATQYSYILRAKDTSGNTRNSSAVTITTSAAGAAPTSGTVTAPAAGAPLTTVTTPTTTAPTAAPGAVSIGLNAGDLVQGTTSKAVYLVGADGKRYVYPNEGTYKSWHADFTKVKKISDSDLASLTLGGFVTMRPGSWLVKIESDPKVYAVEIGGKLRWVETETRAKKLYGDAWNQKIVDVPVSFWVGYKEGAALGVDQHPTGTLVASAGQTYYVDAGKKLLVDSASFSAHGFQQRFVQTLDPSIAYGDGGILASDVSLTFAGTR